MILVPLGLEYFPIPSLTDRDRVCIMLNKSAISATGKVSNILCSAYMDINEEVDICRPLQEVIDLANRSGSRFLIGVDSNAHNNLWGGVNVNKRGEFVEEFILNNTVKLDNIGNTPTFNRGIGRAHV